MTYDMYLALTIAVCILAVFVCFVLGFFCYFLCQMGDYFCAKYRLVSAQEDTEKERYNALVLFRTKYYPVIFARSISDRQPRPIKVDVRKVVQK